MGRKVSDEFTVPLCRGTSSDELHRSGDEVAWWKGQGIDPTRRLARSGWKATHCPRSKRVRRRPHFIPQFRPDPTLNNETNKRAPIDVKMLL